MGLLKKLFQVNVMGSFIASVVGRKYFMDEAVEAVSHAITQAEAKNLPRGYNFSSAHRNRVRFECLFITGHGQHEK
ncbi:MAG: hypothetical protein IT497_02890 [Ottowia sp.]|nr:hypothetical protein [Ottowia sp.]